MHFCRYPIDQKTQGMFDFGHGNVAHGFLQLLKTDVRCQQISEREHIVVINSLCKSVLYAHRPAVCTPFTLRHRVVQESFDAEYRILK